MNTRFRSYDAYAIRYAVLPVAVIDLPQQQRKQNKYIFTEFATIQYKYKKLSFVLTLNIICRYIKKNKTKRG